MPHGIRWIFVRSVGASRRSGRPSRRSGLRSRSRAARYRTEPRLVAVDLSEQEVGAVSQSDPRMVRQRLQEGRGAAEREVLQVHDVDLPRGQVGR
jgi:hypothetical protein